MLKAFSPGARTPPPESVSRWSYHVSCLVHRHSHAAWEKFPAKFTVPGAGPTHPNGLTESINPPAVNSMTLAKLFSYWGKLFQRVSSYFTPHSSTRLISHGFPFFSSVRPSVRLAVISSTSAVPEYFLNCYFERVFYVFSTNLID